VQGASRIAAALGLAGALLVAGAAAGGQHGPARSDAVVGRDWRALASLGLASLQEGRRTADPAWYSRAERALRRSLALHREGNVEAMVGMGVLSLGRHDFADALAWGRRARAISPYDPDARGVIGDALLELGRYRAAARAFQAMIDLRPALSSYARVSYFRELTGDVPGAVRAMRRAVGFAATPDDAAWAGYHLGELYFGWGRLAPAGRAYRAGLAADPGAVLPRVGLARIAAARGDHDRSIRILSNVARRYPAPEIVILLADVQAATGDSEGARESHGLVRAMDRLARSAGVDTDLEMALFFADHGLDGALERARAAYRRRPGVAAADALAWALSAEGHHRAAARRAREAMRLGTRSASFHFHAGMIALRMDRVDRARRLLGEAIEINPHFSVLNAAHARRILDHLEARR
jgi:tetratricopeptide (TPR) repeat protein